MKRKAAANSYRAHQYDAGTWRSFKAGVKMLNHPYSTQKIHFPVMLKIIQMQALKGLQVDCSWKINKSIQNRQSLRQKCLLVQNIAAKIFCFLRQMYTFSTRPPNHHDLTVLICKLFYYFKAYAGCTTDNHYFFVHPYQHTDIHIL